MKKRPLLFLLLSVFLASFLFVNEKEDQYNPRESSAIENGFQGASDYYNMLRANPETGEFDSEKYGKIRDQEKAYRAEKGNSSLGLEWDEMGPDNIGGRTRAIKWVNSNLMFAGAVTGGMFRSTNNGNTWERLTGFDQNYVVTSIDVLGNGHIYVATGSSHEDFGVYWQEFPGGGLFVSTDDGDTWNYAEHANGDPIKPDYGSFSSPLGKDYAIIDVVVADPNQDDKLWVGSNVGLQEYVEGTGFLATIPGLPENICESIAISADGNIIAASIGTSDLYLSTNGGTSFEERAGTGANEIPSNLSRLELAISEDDPDFIYGIGAAGSGLGNFEGVWASIDGGDNFNVIWPGDVPEVDIDPGNQGNYTLAIGVPPGSPGICFTGALDVWIGGVFSQPEQRTFFLAAYDPLFPIDPFQGFGQFNVHVDIHTFEFGEDGSMFVGTDGGIYRSLDGGETFVSCNRFYNATQFYGIGFSHDDKIIGGSQDNSTSYITHEQSTFEEAITVWSGDGFDSEISNLNPDGDVIFMTSQFNNIRRSNDGGMAVRAAMIDFATMGGLPAPFHSIIRLWEDGNTATPYTVEYKNDLDETIPAGTEVTVDSRAWGYTFTETLPADLGPFEGVDFTDPATSLFAAGYIGNGGVWVTRDALYFDTAPAWAKVMNSVAGSVSAFDWSKGDADHLWVGTTSGQVYRISGFANAWTVGEMHVDSADYALTITATSPGGGAVITDIAVDPNDDDHVVITKSGFGGDAKVMEATNGTGATITFNDIWFPATDNLSGMPAWSCIIEQDNPNTIIVGTPWGVYATDNGGADWTPENAGPMGPVPVFDMRQQWRAPEDVENAGYIYLGTHGRGAFRSKTYEKNAIDFGDGQSPRELVGNLVIMPNPMSDYGWLDFTASEKASVEMDIYSISGQKVKALKFTMNEGANHYQFDVSDLGDGTYIIQLKKDDKMTTDKFVIIR